MQLREVLSWQTTEGRPLTLHGRTITPISQALRVSTPVGGFVWNRPVAVLVAEGDVVTRQPIVDVTRFALWAMGGGAVLSIVIAALVRRRVRPEEA
ncbi:MAG: hypothetical protein RRC07_02770 [Anaerolineae bacterium]|nr:hypothetical protein [Anaerolineae bacterium]